MPHMERIGVRALQQNASAILRRVESGERVEITARGRPIAVLVPLEHADPLDRLAAEGRLRRSTGDLLDLGRPPRAPKRSESGSARLARARANER
jgi:prevent-host-death family protein